MSGGTDRDCISSGAVGLGKDRREAYAARREGRLARLSSKTWEGGGADWPDAGRRTDGARVREENLVEREDVESREGENI